MMWTRVRMLRTHVKKQSVIMSIYSLSTVRAETGRFAELTGQTVGKHLVDGETLS